ncbi:hypothetical protein B1218_34540, partial [Pseudomonas ogarae]
MLALISSPSVTTPLTLHTQIPLPLRLSSSLSCSPCPSLAAVPISTPPPPLPTRCAPRTHSTAFSSPPSCP